MAAEISSRRGNGSEKVTNATKSYLNNLEKNLATGDATEHTHRAALASLFESLDSDAQAVNEPRRIECGAPDLAVLKDDLLVGHVEAKDVGAALDQVEQSDQLKRYRQALANLILTDYLEFRWYVDGDLRRHDDDGEVGGGGGDVV